ncbi:hypothetical protein Nit79A3_3108 [Nitrosomonas sp. Is79A3]|uniref:hypothetical protein n=1 Tax=Nitrosomonas sp. (strain Is79A3) TaxID=261292 RepID=UPI000215CBC8
MSTSEERLDIIGKNYRDALENEPYDLARALVPDQITAIQANVYYARTIFYTAVASELSNNNPLVENAYATAQTAHEAIKDARAKAEEIPNFIKKLQTSTKSAKDLLDYAKKVG